MQCLDLEEQEDGSAIATVHMNTHEMMFFIELGVIEAIKRGALETKKGIKEREAWDESRAVGEGSSEQSLHLQEPEEGDEEERASVAREIDATGDNDDEAPDGRFT